MSLIVKYVGGGVTLKPFYLTTIHNYDSMKRTVESCDDAFHFSVLARPYYSEMLAKWYVAGEMICARTSIIKGYAVLYANDFKTKRAYIPMIGVRPEFQKQGCGKALLEECEAVARAKMMENIALEVQKNNLNAIGFYSHLGYHEVACMDVSYIFEKNLSLK